MKKVLSALVVTAALSIATGAMALSIVGTDHDLSSGTGVAFKSNTTQVCVFCHTPHNSAQTRALWNRTNPTTSFALYTSGANIESNDWYVDSATRLLPSSSPSLLCMSCHDGATSLTALSVPPLQAGSHTPLTIGGATNTYIAGTSGANLTNNLTNDHPISIVYEKARVAFPATLKTVTNGAVGGLPLAKGENLECNTCHNVHDNAYAPFLRISNDASALCTACHIK